jgi:translation initiation factor 2-alpha kinase 4
MNALFTQPVDRVRDFLYDDEERPEHSALDTIVEDRLIECFQLHGAVSMDPLLFMPATEADVEDSKTAVFLDRQGELVALPKHAIIPFARIAARSGFERIKRFHIGDTYRSSPSGGHPKSFHVAVFDVITADPSEGVSEAETIGIVSEILNIFPGVNNVQYEVHLSHSQSTYPPGCEDLAYAPQFAMPRLANLQMTNAAMSIASWTITGPSLHRNAAF